MHLICSLEKGKKWKYLIFTGAEISMAAHGKAQLVLRLIATIKAEQSAGLGASQAQNSIRQFLLSLAPTWPQFCCFLLTTC